jgi:hypothetical protein
VLEGLLFGMTPSFPMCILAEFVLVMATGKEIKEIKEIRLVIKTTENSRRFKYPISIVRYE